MHMKTTIDIPDDLMREAKARAALDGITFKALVIDALRAKLHASPLDMRRAKFPIIAGDPNAPPITSEMVDAALGQL